MAKPSKVITMTTSDGLGEIGFSGGVLEQRPTKVKATVATIPVVTESIVQRTVSHGENKYIYLAAGKLPKIQAFLAH